MKKTNTSVSGPGITPYARLRPSKVSEKTMGSAMLNAREYRLSGFASWDLFLSVVSFLIPSTFGQQSVY
ncbi:MAG TPA: hypothetical protein VMT26_05805 [Candidatus Bathyarchaeia archaeon]|nr:hypothetical protein [Candidatus Bathyarchaeia archaeon]